MQSHNLLYDHILFLNGYLVSIFLTRMNKEENVVFVVTSEKLVRRKDVETLKPFITVWNARYTSVLVIALWNFTQKLITCTDFSHNLCMYVIMYDGTTVLNSKFTSGSPFYGLHRINQSHYCYVQSEILWGGGGDPRFPSPLYESLVWLLWCL